MAKWTDNQSTAQLKYLLKKGRGNIEHIKEKNRDIREELKKRRLKK